MAKTMRKIGLLLVLAAVLYSCKSTTKSGSASKGEDSPLLLTVADDKVSVDEFKYVYDKNNSKSGDAYSENSLKEYLDLYINFRLKVEEAEQLGYDTTREFESEFKQYEQQLAQPYLSERSVTEKLVKQAYERKKQEVRASHILIRFPDDPTPQDTLAAFKRINEIRGYVTTDGEDFSRVAGKFSQDPSAKKNFGDLGYFSALQMVYPFENAAYTTEVGAISEIVRTKFGYHILKIIDRRPARGEVRVSHIMISANEGMNPGDIKIAEKKANDIYSELAKGGDWNNLCAQFSEDSRTANKGGSLPWISTGKVSPEFEDIAFGMEKVGEISKPVRTPYGFHILKLNEKKPIESYDKQKRALKMQIERDPRSNLPKTAFIKRIKKENNFVENGKLKTLAFDEIDSTVLEAKWKHNPEFKKLTTTLFSINDRRYSVKQYFEHVEKRQELKQTGVPKMVAEKHYESFVNESLMAYEKEFLEDKYPEYRYTLKEYRYGILLFKLMDEKVWTKAIKDTTGLREYFESNKSKYNWDDRYQMTIMHAENAGILGDAIKDYKSKKYEDLKLLKSAFNKDGSLRLDAMSGKYELKDRPYFDKLTGEPGEYRTVYKDRYYYIHVEEKIPAGPKKFEETKGLLISDYQGKLEEEWIKSLRSKYTYTLNQPEFDKLVKK